MAANVGVRAPSPREREMVVAAAAQEGEGEWRVGEPEMRDALGDIVSSIGS